MSGRVLARYAARRSRSIFTRELIWGIAAFAFVMLTRPNRASAGQTTLGLSLGPLVGIHQESGFRTNVEPLPIPFVSVAYRESALELFAEGLPLSPPIGSYSGVTSLTTHLTFENAEIRGYVLRDCFAIGIGETIYNQESTYGFARSVNTSRVVGGRYEIATRPFHDRRLRLAFIAVPGLHGVVNGRSQTFPQLRYVAMPEHGTQTEANASFESGGSRVRVTYELRYVNYISRLTRTNELADRNTGFRPSIGVALRFGRNR